MTTTQHFRDVMAQRRPYRNNPARSIEWAYLTRLARKLAWIVRGIPAKDWTE